MAAVFSKSTRVIAIALSGVIGATALAPANAAPIPVVKALDAPTGVEQVQYRVKRGPVRVKRRGNNGAAAAAAIGALAIGAAVVAASSAEQRRKRRLEREYYYSSGYPYGYGYAAPQPRYYQSRPYYAPAPQPYYAPQYQGGYYQGGYYQQPVQRRWQRNAPQIDGGSPYAVQRQRQINRQYVPQAGYPQAGAPNAVTPQGIPYRHPGVESPRETDARNSTPF